MQLYTKALHIDIVYGHLLQQIYIYTIFQH